MAGKKISKEETTRRERPKGGGREQKSFEKRLGPNAAAGGGKGTGVEKEVDKVYGLSKKNA